MRNFGWFRRLFNAAGRYAYLSQSNVAQRARRLVFTGGATTLSLSFFGSALSPKTETASNKREPSFDYNIAEADALYNNYLIDNAYAILRKFRKSTNPEALWRLARVVYEQAKTCADPEEKRRLAEEASEHAQNALSHAEQTQSFGAHKWYAITLDYLGELEGSKSRLAKAVEVKTHLQRALELNSLDATTWMILGMWEYAFADMSYITRLAAKALYSSPPTSTYEEALRHFQRAETISPKFCTSNSLYLGLALEALGRKDEAIGYYKHAFMRTIVSADDKDAHIKAQERLKKLGIDASKWITGTPH